MKPIAFALLAGTAALTGTSAIADSRISIGVHVGSPAYAPPPVVSYVPAPTVVHAPPAVVYAPPPPRGYWKEIVVKTWVPERWVMTHDRWGRHVRVCEPGYYTYQTDRVWVEDRHHHHGPSRYGHSYSHGSWRR